MAIREIIILPDKQLRLVSRPIEKVTSEVRKLAEAADEIESRVCDLFRVGPSGKRPSDGARIEATDSAPWREHVTFSEYFDGDTGEGLGASHQTGWTALVAHLLCRPAQDGKRDG